MKYQVGDVVFKKLNDYLFAVYEIVGVRKYTYEFNKFFIRIPENKKDVSNLTTSNHGHLDQDSFKSKILEALFL